MGKLIIRNETEKDFGIYMFQDAVNTILHMSYVNTKTLFPN